jgi:hypothetical protein
LDRFRSVYLGQSPMHARQVRNDQRELWARGGRSDEVIANRKSVVRSPCDACVMKFRILSPVSPTGHGNCAFKTQTLTCHPRSRLDGYCLWRSHSATKVAPSRCAKSQILHSRNGKVQMPARNNWPVQSTFRLRTVCHPISSS